MYTKYIHKLFLLLVSVDNNKDHLNVKIKPTTINNQLSDSIGRLKDL